MLNKLRLKFVGISLTLFGIVLIAFFAITYRNATFEIERNANFILKQLSDNYGKETTVFHTNSNNIIPPNLTLFLDENNQIIAPLTVSNPMSYVGKDPRFLQSYVDAILESNENKGIITVNQSKNQTVRYLVVNKNNNIRITMLSRTYELIALETAYHNAITNTLYLTIILLFTTIILSIWTFKPVKKVWEQQNQFLADASHELRTPLTAIQANLDVVMASPEKTIAEQQKWMNYIKDELIRMKTLSNDLLMLTKNNLIDHEKMYETLHLSNLVLSTILSLESLAFESNKTLISNISKNIYIQGDTNRIKQLLIILIDNAIKYAPPLSNIEIILKKINNRALIIVSNDVDSPIDTNKIFNRFYREDYSRNRQSGGSGLGLSIAKNIVEIHKGKLYAKNMNDKLIMYCSLPNIKK